MNILKQTSIPLFALMLATTNPAYAQDTVPNSAEHSKTTQSIQAGVNQAANDKINAKHDDIYHEAVDAIIETQVALSALSGDNPDTKKALVALEKSTGKLEIILAREPDLKMAPIDVSVETHDFLASPVIIKALIYDAKKQLDKGEVQQARLILQDLVSEIKINTTSIPLVTYPVATKAAAALIDEGKIEEAKAALQSQLETLVVTKEIIPLPILRTMLLLGKAEVLAQKIDRSESDNTTLSLLLNEARIHLEMAELLGYGKKENYQGIYEQIDLLEKKSTDGKHGQGWFDTIKQKISNLF
ncbi:MAG: YfdX family protein [Thiomicrorhabdus sp.]|nr:YfdX family protein [Thiomicrorhabdus sp.]